MIKHLLIGAATFVATNMDDLLILSVYFASARYKTRNIVTGQYLGIVALIAISLVGLVLGEIVDKRWISLLGLLPVLLGIKDLVTRDKDKDYATPEEDFRRSNFQFLNVALVTMANGGDNIGVYAPLFATTEVEFMILYIGIFLVLTGCWCFLGYYAVSHSLARGFFAKYGKILLPYFLIVLGVYILSGYFE